VTRCSALSYFLDHRCPLYLSSCFPHRSGFPSNSSRLYTLPHTYVGEYLFTFGNSIPKLEIHLHFSERTVYTLIIVMKSEADAQYDMIQTTGLCSHPSSRSATFSMGIREEHTMTTQMISLPPFAFLRSSSPGPPICFLRNLSGVMSAVFAL
jgi:hypothetical protein